MNRLILSLLILATACGTTTRQGGPPTAPRPALPHPSMDPSRIPRAQNMPPSTRYVFQGVDLFGAREASRRRVLELITMPAPGTSVDPGQKEFIDRLIESKQRVVADTAYPVCRFSLGQLFETHELYLTVDLVEPGDEWRTRFSAAPTGSVEDPEGLLAAWQAYQTRFFELRRQGAVPEYGYGEGTCHSLYCYGGFAHPELAPLEQRFIDGVPRHTDPLMRVLREDQDAARRLRALMLLTYGPSREWLIQAVLPSVTDPDENVRDQALQLLGAMQNGQPRVLIPLDPVLTALWDPFVAERNKAAWALVRILETEGPVHRQHILDRSGAALLAMDGMKNRLEHEPAHDALALLAGRDLGEDVEAWRKWLAEQQGPPPAAVP